jgi:hypothetical protein
MKKSLTPAIFLLTLLFFLSCSRDRALFRQVDPSDSGITFNNEILETDSVNVIDLENVYNGGGVAAADFNNDGLQDLYFTGNLVSNRLYINKSSLKFEDVTEKAGVGGSGRWSRGVAVVDINNDGWQDIYVCATLKRNQLGRTNLLYINQGKTKDGVPAFREMAEAYGIADTSHSTMAAFFDYDNDGDLDLFIANNEIVKGDYPNRFRPALLDGSHPNTDRLYRNEGSDSLGHPFFRNVSKAAGILVEGYAHGLAIADINQDGWKDIYVSNDYLSGNIMYVNNGDGTFTNRVREYFKHGAANAMGNDISDINNDGLADLVELDMNPEDNFRKKMMMNPNSYQTYQNIDYFGYPYQYVRNSLQLNRGWNVAAGDSFPAPVFAEIAYYAGIEATDWSWTPSVADFDNDGYRDLIITNGFPKDVTDHDFIAYRDEAYMIASKKQLLDQIPAVKLRNYAYHNNGNLTFTKVSEAWGLDAESFTNGAIYVDLDNDGDLDFVSNNINDPAFLFENRLNQRKDKPANFLRVKLQGSDLNKNGIGTWVKLYYGGSQQVVEHSPYRGYLSSTDPVIHFGLGEASKVDSVVILWPLGKKQVLKGVGVNAVLEAKASDAKQDYSWQREKHSGPAVFTDETINAGITYKHEEKDFVDFNIQKLLPHKLSQYGPALAAGDINGDGLDDLMIGGARNHSPVALLQQTDGKFRSQPLLTQQEEIMKSQEDMGLLLFDADLDGDLDLYCASGSYENLPGTPDHRDNFFINLGRGKFRQDSSVFPHNYASKGCVRATDFDGDGDLDLFIAGRVQPGSYPKPVSSFLYRNDTRDGKIRFSDVTAEWAPVLRDIGLVCDALWTDYDNDGNTDLILVGEWMSLRVLRKDGNKLKDQSTLTGVENLKGWWSSIGPGDIDNDGDIDYVVGNLGLNSFYRASGEQPVRIYAKDFDKNGNYDAVPSLYIPDLANGAPKEFPAQTRDDLIKQMVGFRQKFPTYKPFASATMEQMFTPEEEKDMLVLEANEFRSGVFMNNGAGKFSFIPLPESCQWSPVNSVVLLDLDQDEFLDMVVSTNDYGTEVTVGRYDALNGMVLKGDGRGGFKPCEEGMSGFVLPGDGKALSMLRAADGRLLIAASQNRAVLKLFKHNFTGKLVPLQRGEKSLQLYLQSGAKRRAELYYGQGFLSQSSLIYPMHSLVVKMEVSGSTSTPRIVQ